MAAVTLTDIPLDRIEAQAAQIKFGRTVLSLIAWTFYWAGWLVAKLMSVVIWKSATFVTAAVMTGWKEANGPSKRSIIESQRAQIKEMAMRLSRFEG